MPRSHLVIGADGVVLVRRMILLTSTTPAAAFIEASPYRARASRASAFPSSSEEGSSIVVCPCFVRKGGCMFRKRFVFLPSALTLVILVSAVMFSQGAPEYGPAKGTLLIVGGGNLKGSGIYDKFIELAGGPNARYVIVPTAGGNRNPDGSLHIYKDEEVLQPFRELGLKNLVILHTHDPKVANTEEFAK